MNGYGTQIIGPFDTYRVSSDGYEIPHIEVRPLSGANDGSMNVILDGRFCVWTAEEEAKKWLPFLAHAMAVAAGFTCHGENSQEANIYKRRIIEL